MRRKLITLIGLGLVLALFVVPAAAAEILGDVEATEEEDASYSITYNYDPDAFVLLYGLADDAAEGEDVLDCSLDEGTTVEVDDEGTFVFKDDAGDPIEGFELAEGCVAVSVVGPNGQVNHGTIVSNLIHSLKDGFDKDMYGPFGQFVKDIAGDKELGKGDQQVKPNKDDADGDALDFDADDIDGDEDKGKKPEKTNNGNDKGKGKGRKN